MKHADLSGMDAAKLQAFVDTTRNELATLRRNVGLGQETKTADLNVKRKDIARALTQLNQTSSSKPTETSKEEK